MLRAQCLPQADPGHVEQQRAHRQTELPDQQDRPGEDFAVR
ncbi:hypothetical protein [Streptomyces sp. NPDC020996]